jgi:hypothetical protein
MSGIDNRSMRVFLKGLGEGMFPKRSAHEHASACIGKEQESA